MIRGKHPVVAVPVFSRRRHEVGESGQELKRLQLDHAIGSRTRGLPPASWADPVGRLVSGQHVADTGDAAVLITPDGEPLQREGGAARTIAGRKERHDMPESLPPDLPATVDVLQPRLPRMLVGHAIALTTILVDVHCAGL